MRILVALALKEPCLVLAAMVLSNCRSLGSCWNFVYVHFLRKSKPVAFCRIFLLPLCSLGFSVEDPKFCLRPDAKWFVCRPF
jgi:hypothetical protein